MTTEERDAIIRRELDIYDQLDEIESALHKARIALGNLTDEVCQMRRNTETHDIRTETHECVKDTHDKTSPNSSEKPNKCEHITEDGVTCAKYPACDDCPDNPLNKLKGSERLVKGSEKPNNCEPQTYVINPQEPTNDEKCFECDDFFTCGGQCNKIEDEPQTERSE